MAILVGNLVEPHVVPNVPRVCPRATPKRCVNLCSFFKLISVDVVCKSSKRVSCQIFEVNYSCTFNRFQSSADLFIAQTTSESNRSAVNCRRRGSAGATCIFVFADLDRNSRVVYLCRQSRVLQEAVLSPFQWATQMRHGTDHLLEVEDVVERAREGEAEVRARDGACVRGPPPVEAAPQLRDDHGAVEEEAERKRVADLLDLMVREPEVPDGPLWAHRRGRRLGAAQQVGRDVHVERQEAPRAVKVLGRVQPHEVLPEAVPLARRARELERGVHHKRLKPEAVGDPLDEEGVAARKDGDREDAEVDLAIEGPEEVAFPRRVGAPPEEVVEGVLVPVVGVFLEGLRPVLGELPGARRAGAEEHDADVGR
mmetsp:Transcript_26358/g.62614  ORF Transcript_26358/g.62614 Transcript_26358/m.62614 type:complete len:369 (+) Transcript_26358:226-1332(+)